MAKQLILKDGTIVPGYDNETEFMNDMVTAHLRDRLLLLCDIPKCRNNANTLRRLDGDLKRKMINITHCSQKVDLKLDLKFERDVLIDNDHLKAEMLALIDLLQNRCQEHNSVCDLEKLNLILLEVDKIPLGITSEPIAHETFKMIMENEHRVQKDMSERALRFAEQMRGVDWSKLEGLKD